MSTENLEKTAKDKRAEKLNALCAKRAKALAAQEAAEKQIAKIKSDIHNDEVKKLDALCTAKQLSYADIISFIVKLGDLTLADAAEMLGLKEDTAE